MLRRSFMQTIGGLFAGLFGRKSEAATNAESFHPVVPPAAKAPGSCAWFRIMDAPASGKRPACECCGRPLEVAVGQVFVNGVDRSQDVIYADAHEGIAKTHDGRVIQGSIVIPENMTWDERHPEYAYAHSDEYRDRVLKAAERRAEWEAQKGFCGGKPFLTDYEDFDPTNLDCFIV